MGTYSRISRAKINKIKSGYSMLVLKEPSVCIWSDLFLLLVVFAVSIEFIIHFLIFYISEFFCVDGVILCAVECVGDTANLKGSYHHLLWNVAPCLLNPTKYKISWRSLLLAGRINSKGPVNIHDRYCFLMLSLNGLLRHLSNGCRNRVRPPGMTASSTLRRCRSALTDSVRWARNESLTNSNRSLVELPGRLIRIHSFKPTNKKTTNIDENEEKKKTCH